MALYKEIMLQVESVTKQFLNKFVALDNVSLQVNTGEIVSLVGTSGCGKSTLLRMVAGLDKPTSGRVIIAKKTINSPHPAVGIVFQEPRLMPWLTVRKNIEFGLERISPREKAQKATSILERVGLAQFAQALPRQLSGGMAQRVAIARALITNPSVLLLDEPFSALDAFTRLKLQKHLLQIWDYDRPTMLLVTHDIEEALVLSDRIIVMGGNPGQVLQEYIIDLPRPRQRTTVTFQRWKEQILNSLDLFEKTMLVENAAIKI
ncbi:ABC transporter ATP-binding protein [Synechocystis sp. PCC 7509]|uniref:ABC transporter ATP-binding protein n=1 Tax=Synechocystis sp. PCC 7509 TaxID=927677 RepID=UPI0002AC17DC|nr:ABC transporter ATP-binding protein [Synechocystis sp. PCC 7509]